MSGAVPAAATGWPGHFTVRPAQQGDRPPRPTMCEATVLTNDAANDRYWRLRLHAPEIALTARPGQFVMLTAARAGEWDPALPRPMAIMTRDPRRGTIEILYARVGRGTAALSTFPPGEAITTVGPLGRGFELERTTTAALLIGRGIGTCSLTMLASEAAARGVALTAVDSARSPTAAAGTQVYGAINRITHYTVNDADGSSAPDLLARRLAAERAARPPQQIFVCGSQRLLSLAGELAVNWHASVQVAVEAHMACGIGYCHGCSSGLRTAESEAPLVCRDGPVFDWSPRQPVESP